MGKILNCEGIFPFHKILPNLYLESLISISRESNPKKFTDRYISISMKVLKYKIINYHNML